MDDPQLPGAAGLLGPEARTVLDRAVEHGEIRAARPTQVRYDPGRRLAVRYAADVAWVDGTRRTETLGAVVDHTTLPAALSVVPRGGGHVGVWRYPHDPFLPGLAWAAEPARLGRLLGHLGVSGPVGAVEPVVYRPTARAVLRVHLPGRTLYAKIVRPDAALQLRTLHAAFPSHVPAPHCLAASTALGVVVLEALPGLPLSRAVLRGRAVPEADEVVAVLDGVRAVQLPSARPARCTPVRWYADVLTAAVPSEAERVDGLAAAAQDRGVRTDTTVHGDFSPAQLLVRGAAVCGLLDLDGAGRGSTLDDPANLIAHLVALEHTRPAAADRLRAYRRAVVGALGVSGDDDAFRATVTGVLLALATAPFRRQDRQWPRRTTAWLDVVERWAAGAV